MRIAKLCPNCRYATKTQISLDPKKYRYVGEISSLMERFIDVIFADSSADVCPVIKQRLNIRMAESSLALPFLQMYFFLIVV